MEGFRHAHVEREMELYGYDRVVRSHCRMCHGGCGVLVFLKGEEVKKILGDPDCPINHGTLCSKAMASTRLLYHPQRLLHPLRRKGPKGSGLWERISWDEALGLIAERILHYKGEHGAESIVMGYGTGRENEAVIYRFANLLGTPNVLTAGHFCYGPRVATSIITCGSVPVADYDNKPACILVWGNNLVISNPDEYKGEGFSQALDAGAWLIAVDPRLTRISARANLWLRPRPGTDTALALGLAHVIVTEGLFDRDFVQNHVYGWERFQERVAEYPPERVEQITWVPQEETREAARLFARSKPAVIQWGVAIEQQNTSADTNRALLALLGITGNIDVPGGQVLFSPPKVRTVGEFGAHKMLPQEQRAKRLGGERFRLAGNFGIINPGCVWEAILQERPYPVKMLFFISSNPLLTRANASQVRRALEKVEFMAVADFFMTPTAELADVVLPAATWLEMDYIGDFWKRHGYILPRRKVVQIGECKSDHEMLNELAHKVGQGEHWWKSFQGGLDWILEPMGMSWEEFKDRGEDLRGEVRYRKYESRGFSTPTRKFELYSTLLETWGYDPLPQFREPPESPVSTPDLYKQYPYILITGRRLPGFFHTENRQLRPLRQLHPEPILEIHPQAASKEGIRDGDMVMVESPRGQALFKARLFEGMDPRILSAEHAWWFPEEPGPDHGWRSSNINLLTRNDYESCDPAMGATPVRTLLCRLRANPDHPNGKSGSGAQTLSQPASRAQVFPQEGGPASESDCTSGPQLSTAPD